MTLRKRLRRYARRLITAQYKRARELRLGIPGPLVHRHDRDLNVDLDLVLAHYRLKKPDITFLQVGAFDGVARDPISPLVDKYNLRGILIEPQKEFFNRLTQAYSRFNGADRFKFFNVVIAEKDGVVPFYRIASDAKGPDWLHAIASLDRNNIIRHAKYAPGIEAHIVAEQLEALSFSTLLQKCSSPYIDLLQIDAEGYDAKLIKEFNVPARKPAIINFEHKLLELDEYEQTLNMLLDLNYRIAVSNTDTLAYRNA
jgi:FkbM family methyltransferase